MPRIVIDRAALEKRYRNAVLVCSAMLLMPLLLLLVAWVLSQSRDPAGAGSGSISPLYLWILGLVALSPLVTVPFFRKLMRQRPLPKTASGEEGVEALIATEALTAYAMWEMASLIGLVGFIRGATWTFMLAAIMVNLAGWAMTFPRWPDWSKRADELEAQGVSGAAVELD